MPNGVLVTSAVTSRVTFRSSMGTNTANKLSTQRTTIYARFAWSALMNKVQFVHEFEFACHFVLACPGELEPSNQTVMSEPRVLPLCEESNLKRLARISDIG